MRLPFLLALLAGLAGCSSNGGEPDGQAPAQVHPVYIHGGDFDPRTITMPAGDTLYFESHEAGPHRAVADGYDTGDLGLDDGRSFDDMRAGTHEFRCSYHPEMRVVVTVQ